MLTFKKISFFFLFLLLLLSGLFIAHKASAKSLEEIQKDIEQYQSEITRLGSQANTLKNQIAQFNAQISLTELKIEETEERILLLGGRIDQLEGSLETLTAAFNNRATETYKMTRLGDPALFLLTSADLSQAVSRYFYLQRIQKADQDLLARLQEAQNVYQGEKDDQEDLHDDLEIENKNLTVQKSAKSALLAQTQNDEVKYQDLLAQALAEKSAIENALVSGVKVGPVSKGDPIALVGNSGYPGCSTGKHLHFEVRNGENWVNPSNFLTSKTVQDDQNGGGSLTLGSGSWSWPIQDTVRLTQHYGNTPYSWKYSYSGGIHTGFDMVSTGSDVIRAPEAGILYKSSQSCGSSIINIVYIDHGNGVLSFYLHVQ